MMRFTLVILAVVFIHQTLGLIKGIKIDTKTSTWRDDRNRSRIWHGINFVKKGAVRFRSLVVFKDSIQIQSKHTTPSNSRFTRRSQRI